jgi:hypothetical protein
MGQGVYRVRRKVGARSGRSLYSVQIDAFDWLDFDTFQLPRLLNDVVFFNMSRLRSVMYSNVLKLSYVLVKVKLKSYKLGSNIRKNIDIYNTMH